MSPGGEGPFVPPSLQRLAEWVCHAQPNARLIYAQGNILSAACPAPLRLKVWELAAKGFLTAHYVRRRNGEPSLHLVQRTHRPFVKGMVL